MRGFHCELRVPPHLATILNDPQQLIHTFSLYQNHQAITVELLSPLTKGVPVEEGEYFSYARWIVNTFPNIIQELQRSLGPELKEATVSSNQSAQGMFTLLRKVFHRNMGGRVTEEMLHDGFEPNQANASTAGQWNVLQKADVQAVWNKHRKPIVFTATGVGASIALLAIILGKRNQS